jgi:uncharacterized protein YjiS (DUF1127 family)
MSQSRFELPAPYLVEDQGVLAPLALALVRRLHDWLVRRTVLDELLSLDRRTLLDLGITRGDFEAIAEGRYRRHEGGDGDDGAPTPEVVPIQAWPL